MHRYLCVFIFFINIVYIFIRILNETKVNLIEFKVCKYRNCKADGDSAITSAASLRALDAFCSPSATIT